MIVASENIPQLIADLKKARFYGLLSLQFRNGEITLIERKETILTDKSSGGTRNEHTSQQSR
jgi:hypothetical protein